MDTSTTSPFPGDPSALPPLSAERTTFVGRTREIEALSALLLNDDVRIVTLTGPGGIGKTRLARKVANSLQPRFEHGATFVSLESISDPRLVSATIASHLHLKPPSDTSPDEALVTALANSHMLLVLDNFEQILEAALGVSVLLVQCPRLKILVTSRAPLAISGEHTFPVAPLELVDELEPPSVSTLESTEATRLFVERAKAIDPRFVLSPENAGDIAGICQRLDGLPLAIEIAAAHIRLFPPRVLRRRIESDLPLPLSGPRDAPARQQSLHNTISWSHELLAPSEQVLFRCLGIFTGGFDLEAAEAVCGIFPQPGGDPSGPKSDILTDLGSLLTHSLVFRNDMNDQARYSMLVSIRAFSHERLAEHFETERIRLAHARWHLNLAENLRWGWMIDSDQLSRLHLEHPNMLQALEYFLDIGDSDSALRLATALAGFWYVHTHFELGSSLLKAALESAPDTSGVLRGRALVARGMLLAMRGEWDESKTQLSAGVTMLEASEDTPTMCLLRIWQGATANYHMDYRKAESCLHEALALAKRVPNPTISAALTARTLSNLGITARGLNDLPRAIEWHDSAIRINREHGFTLGVIRALYDRGEAASDQGDNASAMEYFRECLSLLGESGDRRVIVDVLERSALIAAAWQQEETATRLLGAAESLSRPYGGFAPPMPDYTNRELTLKTIRAQLGGQETDQALAEGRALPLDAVIRCVEALAPKVPPGRPEDADNISLSKRELEVLRMLVDGSSNREIANTLFISIRTVEAHIARIRQKLGVKSRTAAVSAAIAAGIIPPGSPPTRNA